MRRKTNKLILILSLLFIIIGLVMILIGPPEPEYEKLWIYKQTVI